MEKDILNTIKKELLKREDKLSKYATKSIDAIRLSPKDEDFRPPFFRDTDSIIHSNPYARYIDKTQVYSFSDHDHITKRSLHVQLVSKIARTIGRCLNLNEDLIEAIGLGHDVGHTPLGHVGEKILDKLSLKELNEPFMHNLQSVRTFMNLTNNGNGNNLTIQVLDGMMCHNGEVLEQVYIPRKKTKEEFLNDYYNSCKSASYASEIRPMTLEGCIVRISDVIAYIGRDIEDAIILGKLKREDIPKEITSVIGNNNKDIINSIVIDIVENSYGKNKIILSDKVFNALQELVKFNYKNIYNFANTKEDLEYYNDGINKLYYTLLEDLEKNKKKSKIYKCFLCNMNNDYIDNTDNKRIVIDYIAGMTDDYLINEIKGISVNKF